MVGLVAMAAVLSAGVFLMDPGAASAQESDYRWAIGPWLGGYKFIGGEGDRAKIGPEGGFELQHRFSERLTFALRAGYGENGEWDGGTYRTLVFNSDLVGQVNLILDKPTRPYLLLGIGVNSWRSEYGHWDAVVREDARTEDPTQQVEGTGFAIKLGGGVERDITERLFLNARVTYDVLMREDDELDLGGLYDPNDAEVEITAGFLYRFSGARPGTPRERDSDRDGISDSFDRCPGTPRGVAVDRYGCPADEDGDGVPDTNDECPGTPAGATVDERGCPSDEDGDGVYNGIDRCPDTPRRAEVDRRGCPTDSDRDGVYNGIDQCPDTPRGATVNARGCTVAPPPEPEPVVAVLEGVTFASGTSGLLPEALVVLNGIARDLIGLPDLRVEIRGHTDSSGEDQFNVNLSQQRADAVRDYLISRGVSPDRMTAVGYGESEPVATNDTAEGRVRNRRVEFLVLE
ncbi:MAG: OmpA family protein [Candidatus Eisenbacteria sp.]|nr:OmpA family protein [Candidatus Eisenbacteria bacterium]